MRRATKTADKRYLADVRWHADDVVEKAAELGMNVNSTAAYAWLRRYERIIRGVLTARGWDLIEDFMLTDPPMPHARRRTRIVNTRRPGTHPQRERS